MELLEYINGGKVLYKDSTSYESHNWKHYGECHTKYPIQRKLTLGECVFDLDKVTKLHFNAIPAYLELIGMKIIAYKTSNSGMHIHFWTDIYDKEQKKQLVKYMSEKIETIFGVKNDLLPMGHGHIRAENSFHPVKNTQKIMIKSNVTHDNYLTYIDDGLKQKVFNFAPTVGKMIPKSGGKLTTCMKYIMNHKFADGRNRLMFCIASWFKGDGKPDNEIHKICHNWVKEQGANIPSGKIWATVKSCNGTVGCSYRHALLEELGVDMSHCTREE